MKINDLRDFSKDDVLSALGLTSKPSTSDRLLGALSIFGVGLLVGAGAALLLAPKSGEALRADLGERLRHRRNEEAESPQPPEAETANGEART
jgi:YtxH-like protein